MTVTAAAPTPVAPRWTRRDRLDLAGMAGFVLLLNLVGWGVLLLAIAPAHYTIGGTGAYGIGVGVTAFLLGVRHAFDADHIAVIDNTTRKLVGEGRSGLGVGFWFSLGHSSVVFGASLLLALGMHGVAGTIQHPDSGPAQGLGVIGSAVAGCFLIAIGLMNLSSALGIARVFRGMRSGETDPAELERHLHNRGFLARLVGGLTGRVQRPWQVYPVGLLMGLGFDTATQVALLVLATGTATTTLPWYAVLVLPVLFTAGMALFDTADGVFMARAYRWAFVAPVRKVFYNLTVTVLSVVAALVVGIILLAGLVADRLDVHSGPLAVVGELSLNSVGYLVVGVFAVTWVVALATWKIGRIEERWTASCPDGN